MTRRIVLLTLLLLQAAGSAAEECGAWVADVTGHRLCVPPKIERIIITCYGGASQEIALFMGGDRIVAQPGVGRFPQFTRLFPGLKELPSVGSFADVNLESVMRLRPKIVFAGVTSAAMNAKIEKLGIPVFTLGIGRHSVQTLLEEFLQVGTLLHQEEKAAGLVAFWRERLEMIRSRLAAWPQPRKRLFYTAGSGKKREGGSWWEDDFISAAGGINVAQEAPPKGAVSAETLSLWNPDVILFPTNKSAASSAESFRKDPRYGHLEAVRQRQVYAAPVGTFWWDRPSPESILGILWLSKLLYPEAMQEVDLKKESRAFYRRFYGYTLSDAEYEGFFSE